MSNKRRLEIVEAIKRHGQAVVFWKDFSFDECIDALNHAIENPGLRWVLLRRMLNLAQSFDQFFGVRSHTHKSTKIGRVAEKKMLALAGSVDLDRLLRIFSFPFIPERVQKRIFKRIEVLTKGFDYFGYERALESFNKNIIGMASNDYSGYIYFMRIFLLEKMAEKTIVQRY